MGPININSQVTQEVSEINTEIKPDKNDIKCSNRHIFQIIQKEQPREKN